MNITDLILPERVIVGLRVGDKAQLLAELSRRAAHALNDDAGTVLAELERREQLGSTGLGHGFALPHARFDGLRGFFALFARLVRPIDFNAIDGVPVDLVTLLMMPRGSGGEDIAALAAIARPLRNRDLLHALRHAKDAAAVYKLLVRAGSRASGK